MVIQKKSFGKSPDGQAATIWVIENSQGAQLGLTDWGATTAFYHLPDGEGRTVNVLLGYPDASGFTNARGYQGATCGRFANRIALGRFHLEGHDYELACNNEPNHLHGGDWGLNRRIWQAEPYTEGNRSGVVFTTTSPDGEEGYPGTLQVRADYALDEEGSIFMDFQAQTNKATPVNLTNHAYWNLAGTGTILNHQVKFHASRYLPVDDTAIPTGEQASVEGGPFDFRQAKSIGQDIQSAPGGGYDHCIIIDGEAGELRPAVEVFEPQSGRRMILKTDRPGVQFYSGNFLDGNPFEKHAGFCLEPEDFPDAPNQPSFPSTILQPGERYHHRSIWEFPQD